MIETEQTEAHDGRKARGARSRAVILERAAAIASTDGLDGLTIGRLATEAGVAKGNIQVLFGDKEALQLATIEWVAELYRATIVAPFEEEASPLARLTGMIERWYDFVETRTLPGGCFMNAVSSEFRARPGAIRDRVTGHRLAKHKRYLDAIQGAKRAGEIGSDVDAEQLAFELLAYQAAANVASTIGDDEQFSRARETSRRRLASIAAR